MPPSSPSYSSFSYSRKLRFFTHISQFLHSNTDPKVPKPSSVGVKNISDQQQQQHKQVVDVAIEGEREDSSVFMLQRAVKSLHFGGPKEKEMAAMEIQRLAKKNFRDKKLMAELGVIPPLVAMAASEVAGRRLAGVTALVELVRGTYRNKALVVEAGLLEKLPNKIDDAVDEATRRGFSELLLSLSSLNNSHVSLRPSHVLPFTLAILDSDSKTETKDYCLGTLFNYSTVFENAANLGSNPDMVDSLLRLVSSSKPLSEKALATLGNIVITFPGKKTVENSGSVPHGLIEALTWEDFPKVQELAAYVLMVLAHHSSTQRAKMESAGIVSVLLEVALLGSPLAQKRAMKLLQWFKDERKTSVGSHSSPQARRLPIGSPLIDRREGQEMNKRVMQRLVKDSLKKNMEIITERANYNWDDNSSSKLKSVVISTSSKSLPY